MPEFSDPQNPDNARTHSRNSREYPPPTPGPETQFLSLTSFSASSLFPTLRTASKPFPLTRKKRQKQKTSQEVIQR